MKKAVGFILILGIIISFGTPASAEMEDIIENHWSKDIIRKEFFIRYFPYLAKGNFERFAPNEIINEGEFLLSFSSLLKDKDHLRAILSPTPDRNLTRGEMARLVGDKLMEIGLISSSTKEIPFVDIENISIDEKLAINSLFNAGLIHGETKTTYNPKRNITQAEAIIILQRIDELFDKVTDISFNLLGIVQTYSGREGLTTTVENDKVLVTITKEFPTPGYSMEVKEVLKTNGEYRIYLNIIPPSEDSIELQVITYKTITIEINKEDLGNPPYNFVLGDFL